MSTRTLISMLAVVAFSAATLIGGDTTRDRQMQRAIELLDGKGDAVAAAKLFEQVARGSTDALAGRALLYLAETQKRRGQEQAQIATYRRILNEFSTHRDVAAAARARLAAIQGPVASEPEGMHKKDGTEEDADAWAHLTPDGRFLSRADPRTGDVIIRNMLTGERTRLMAKRDTLEASSDHAELPMISPDGKKVVYVWIFRNGAANHVQLRLMPNQRGATSKALIENEPKYAYFEPIGWLDSNTVLVTGWKSDNTSDFLWVPLNGPFKVLKTLGARLGPSRPRLSPDGRYLAYSATPDEPSSADQRRTWRTQGPLHLYVLATDFSGQQSDIVRGSINESPIWSPDGRQILFISNRSDGFGLWSVDVRNGERLGIESYFDSANVATRIRPIGMTSSGTLFYVPETRGAGVDVYHMPLDPKTGHVAKDRNTRLLDTLVNRSQAPSWSSDGKFIAFKRQPAVDPEAPRQDQLEIVIYSMTTGKVDKTYRTSEVDAGQAIWQPDGPHMLVRRRRDGGLFQYRPTANTNNLRPIESVLNTRMPPECGSHVLSRDGRTLYLSVLDPLPTELSPEQRASAKRTRRLVAMDMDDGDQHELMRTQTLHAMSVLAASPEDSTLALAMMEEGWERPRLMLATVANQRITNVRELSAAILPRAGSWTKAGLLIAADTGERFEVVRVSVSNGAVTSTGLSLARGQFFDVSPDGTQIVYSERSGKRGPLWTYNRLLPGATKTSAVAERLQAGR